MSGLFYSWFQKLYAGHLELLNFSFLVEDDKRTCKDILFGLPVSPYLGIHPRTLLERRCKELTNTDCAGVEDLSRELPTGRLGRLMLSPLQQRYSQSSYTLNPDKPPADY